MEKKILLASSVFAFAVSTTPVCPLTIHAQDEFMLEEITVTAQKRKENVQKTPMAVTALTALEISNKQKNTLDEVLREVPGVQTQGMVHGGAFFIRGIGTNSMETASVYLNVDGVYQGESKSTYESVYDVSRVEVLRGPVGTLYGRNATAGSVNIITNEVDDEYEASGSLQIGNYDEVRAEGMVNVPVNEQLGFRTAFVAEQREGYLSNGNMNADIFGARLKVKYLPTDNITLVATYEHKLDQSTPGTVAAPLSSHSDPWYSEHVKGIYNFKTDSYSLNMDWDLGWGLLKFIPAYTRIESYANIEMITEVTAQAYEKDTNTGELRLSSPSDSKVKWVGGVFYLKEEGETEVEPYNRLDPESSTQPNGDPTAEEFNLLDTPDKSSAMFAQITYPVLERLRLTGGTRYTWDKKELDYKITIEATGYESDVYHEESDFSRFTYSAGIEYDLNNNSMLYATVSTGYNTGGFVEDNPPIKYDPEKLTAYMLGSKNRFLDNRLQVNVEAFHYDYEDYQVQYPGENPATGLFTMLRTNAASTTTYGLEVENNFLLTANDRIDLSVSYLKAEFNDFVFETVFGVNDFSNSPVPNSPKWSVTIGYEHYWNLSNGGQISIEGSIQYKDEYWTTFEKYFLESLQESYTRSDIYLAYYSPYYNWSVRLYCKNIENDAQRIYAMPANRVIISTPRTYGFKVSVRF